ncbi:hypothetical protein F5Y07DRAFT_136690 [Xylaria sp. FL0933]|nr:hypothetical protein F5Y07DRAFT_136690 [Xylaria sp. FL0933]
MSTTVHLKATYTSPSIPNPQTISSTSLTLPSSLSNSQSTTTQAAVKDKTAFLRALRAATTDLQDRINADLTARMEQDAANANACSGSTKTVQGEAGAGAAIVNEVAEEENYGEEVVDEDDEEV